jgi:hypothetical protein
MGPPTRVSSLSFSVSWALTRAASVKVVYEAERVILA